MNLPSDQELTESGFVDDKPASSILVIACGALAREILALREALGLNQLALQCLPAILHNRPEKIPDAVEDAVKQAQGQYDKILIGYADCGTGGELAKRCEKLGVEMIEGPHCYSFFIGNEKFAAEADDDLQSFFLTDFLARQFDTFVIKPLGLDRHPELRDMYFGHYRKLVYLAQTEDAGLVERARQAAESLGLEFELRQTGYGDLREILARQTEAQ